MILFIALATLVLTYLLTWLWVEKSRRPGVPRPERQRNKVWLELFVSATCLLDFVKDRHSLSGGFFGALGLALLAQSIYTIVKYATRAGAEPEYRRRAFRPPLSDCRLVIWRIRGVAKPTFTNH